jgi:hypothetical protein
MKTSFHPNKWPLPSLAALGLLVCAAAIVPVSNRAHALTQTYRNATYHFSLLVPTGFKATELPMLDPGTSTTVFIQNENGDGIQIRISSWDDPAADLTQESITSDTGLSVIDPQPVLIPHMQRTTATPTIPVNAGTGPANCLSNAYRNGPLVTLWLFETCTSAFTSRATKRNKWPAKPAVTWSAAGPAGRRAWRR